MLAPVLLLVTARELQLPGALLTPPRHHHEYLERHMKLIDISTRKYPNSFAKVDDCDFDSINKWKWHAKIAYGGIFYAARSIHHNGKVSIIRMHRLILKTSRKIDHRDGDALNNQRNNLRPATDLQNARNRKLSKNNKTGYIGVVWRKKEEKFWSRISVNHKMVSFGYFDDPVVAAIARDLAAKKYYGAFAKLNFEWLRAVSTPSPIHAPRMRR